MNRWILIPTLLGIALALVSCGEAKSVAQEEFGPRGALDKYEWFKDAAQQIEAKKRDIQNYESLVASTEEEWGETPRTEWPRDVRQGLQQNKLELAGLITAYNDLVAEYRAASAKFNWSLFEDRDDRPPLQFEDYRG